MLPLWIQWSLVYPQLPEIDYHIASIMARRNQYAKAYSRLLKALEKGFELGDLIEKDSDWLEFTNSPYYIDLSHVLNQNAVLIE